MFDASGYNQESGAILVLYKSFPDSSKPTFTFGLVYPDYERTLHAAADIRPSPAHVNNPYVDLALRVHISGIWTTCRITDASIWVALYPVLRGMLCEPSPSTNLANTEAKAEGETPSVQPSSSASSSISSGNAHGPCPYPILEIRPAMEPKYSASLEGNESTGLLREKGGSVGGGALGGMGFSIGGIRLG